MTDQALKDERTTEQTVIRKIMNRLIPFLAILYVFNLIDRGNVSIAALTMQTDLKFSDTVYGFGAGIFYIGYFLLEVPSNMVMERVGARRWMARIMISWGIISACMMFVRDPISFYSLRFLLGVAEAGFYPGIILYITYWVPSSSRARVIARFLSLQAILGLFGGPLGGQLLRLDHVGGLRGWQWLFLLEGLPSVICGFFVLRFLPDGPTGARWLSPPEKAWITSSLAADNATTTRVHHLSPLTVFKDLRIFHLCLIFILTSTAGNAVGVFGPQLIKARSAGLWPDSAVATVLIIPGIVGAIAMVLAAAHSDRTGHRRMHVAIGYFVGGLGFLLCVHCNTAWLVILALSINALGERAAAGSYWAVTTNLMGARAAASGIALINSIGNLGGFFGPWIMGYLKQRSHGDYTLGLYTAAALMATAAALSLLLQKAHKGEAQPAEEYDAVEAAAQPEHTLP